MLGGMSVFTRTDERLSSSVSRISVSLKFQEKVMVCIARNGFVVINFVCSKWPTLWGTTEAEINSLSLENPVLSTQNALS